MIQNNVYQGSRYVPKIIGVWDNSKNTSYESLSVVTWGGNSYTSKKIVPAGINISNESYWCLTSSYNVQLENYKNDLDSFKEQVVAGLLLINEQLDSINEYISLHP